MPPRDDEPDPQGIKEHQTVGGSERISQATKRTSGSDQDSDASWKLKHTGGWNPLALLEMGQGRHMEKSGGVEILVFTHLLLMSFVLRRLLRSQLVRFKIVEFFIKKVN